MEVNYKITEYFDKNNLFDDEKTNGLTLKNEKKTLLIKGKPRDLVELADLLVNIALHKSSHIHIDNLTLINEKSDVKEIIIENEGK